MQNSGTSKKLNSNLKLRSYHNLYVFAKKCGFK